MSKKAVLPRRYTDEFRIEAVRLGEWPEASHKKAAAYFAKESR